MKLSAFLLMTIISISGFTQDIIGIYHANQIIADKMENFECKAKYHKDDGYLFLEADGTNRNVTMMLDRLQRSQLQGYLEKFKEWKKIADSAKVTAERLIGELNCYAGFQNPDWFFNSVIISFKFFSIKDDKGILSQELAIIIPEIVASSNEFIKVPSRIIWVKPQDIDDLIKCISNKYIQKYLDTRKEYDKKQDELFK